MAFEQHAPAWPAVEPVATGRARPVVYLAVAGAIVLAFELFVLTRWATGPTFARTPTGPDSLSGGRQAFYTGLQVVVTGLIVPCGWFWVVRPWRREGRLTTDGMFAIAAAMLFFWDMSMNYTSTVLFYNSSLVNFGAWANGAWPGWTSPGANLLPEPIFIVMPAYTTLVFVQVIVILGLLRRVKRRRPQTGFLTTVITIVAGLTITDTIVEGAFLRTGIYAYPGAIPEITLWAGRTYQVPLSETFFFGGLGLGAIAMLMHFRDDRGMTVVERGLDQVRLPAKGRQWVKFLAIFGAVHLAFIATYVVPQQWFATHSGTFPEGYPSYMVNGMCQAGADGRTCPGPGTPMPRPGRTP
jgi:hypothetical protein